MIDWFIEWAVYITAWIGVGVVTELVVGTLHGDYLFTRHVKEDGEG